MCCCFFVSRNCLIPLLKGVFAIANEPGSKTIWFTVNIKKTQCNNVVEFTATTNALPATAETAEKTHKNSENGFFTYMFKPQI